MTVEICDMYLKWILTDDILIISYIIQLLVIFILGIICLDLLQL